MARRHKLRLCFLSSFKICRSKNPKTLVVSPLPTVTYVFTPVNSNSVDISIPGYPDPPSSMPDQCTSQGHVMSTKIVPFSQECRSKSCIMYENIVHEYSSSHRYPKTRKGKEKIHSSPVLSSDSVGDACPIASSRNETKKMKSKANINTSTSSVASYETDCPFSSPTSFDSSHGEYPLKTINDKQLQRRKKIIKQKNAGARRFKCSGSTEWEDGDLTAPLCQSESTEKASVSGRLMPCKVDGKVNQSFVVVKRSVNPFEDFKKSMLEMIMDKHMFEPMELEELLMSFLYLNSRLHHKVIIEAFIETMKEVNCQS